MQSHPLSERQRALEEDYFRRVEEERLRRLREDRRGAALRRELGAELEMDDESVLDSLIRLGVDPETAAAFETLPLVEVAWADGGVDPDERWRVLELATGFGLELGRPAHAQLEVWLRQRPRPELFEAWCAFAASSRGTPGSARRLARVLERAREVAAAAGGFLGIGVISAAERAILARIERAVSGPEEPGA